MAGSVGTEDTSTPALSLASLMGQLSKLFLPQTTVTKGTASPTALAGLQSTAAQASSNANNATSITQNLVNNIMKQSMIKFAPELAQERSAGMYNTSTMNLLHGNALAQAASDASNAVLNYQTSQQQIANQANQSAAVATRGTTATVKPPITSTILGYGGLGLGALKLLSSKDKILNALGMGGGSDLAASDSAADAIVPAGGTVSDVPSIDSVIGSPLAPTGAATSFGDVASPAAAAVPQVAANTADNVVSDAAGALPGLPADITAPPVDVASAMGDTAAPAATSVTGDVGSAAADASSTAGSSINDNVVFDTIGGINPAANAVMSDAAGQALVTGGEDATLGATAGDVADNMAGNVAGDSMAGYLPYVGTAYDVANLGNDISNGNYLGAVGDVVGAAVSLAGSVICGLLTEQNKLDRRQYVAVLRHFYSISQIGRTGYYIWAIPTVRYMRQHPTSWFSKAVAKIILWRTENIAAYSGVRNTRKRWIGYASRALVFTVSASCAIGYLARNFGYWDLSIFSNSPAASHLSSRFASMLSRGVK